MSKSEDKKEGGLDRPIRHPIDWQSDDFYDEVDLLKELERVFDVCHGCRRCFNLCNAFPRLFDAIDESETLELDSVDQSIFWEVADDCYLCDRCFLSKCPYVPPHPLNIDFPHLMLRAKAIKHKLGKTKKRDNILTSTDKIGQLAGIPVVVEFVNAANNNRVTRQVMHHSIGIHKNAKLPKFAKKSTYRQLAKSPKQNIEVKAGKLTQGKVLLFSTCYGRYNRPDMVRDLQAVLEHNSILVEHAIQSQCCAMPKLEIGDLKAVETLKNHHLQTLLPYVEKGFDILAPIPSCVLMLRNELPLMFESDAPLKALTQAIFDPFEYLALRKQEGLLNTDFTKTLGTVAYHAPCHTTALAIGYKTRDMLALIPGTDIHMTDRCSGHDGTYGIRKETHEISMKIGRPAFRHFDQAEAQFYTSDCPIAGLQLEEGSQDRITVHHPIALLKLAYGIE